MRLTDEQVRQYDEDGYVVLHGILTPAEVRLLQAEAEILRTDQRGHPDANVYEKDGVSLRAAWCVEMDSEACRLAMSMQLQGCGSRRCLPVASGLWQLGRGWCAKWSASANAQRSGDAG